MTWETSRGKEGQIRREHHPNAMWQMIWMSAKTFLRIVVNVLYVGTLLFPYLELAKPKSAGNEYVTSRAQTDEQTNYN